MFMTIFLSLFPTIWWTQKCKTWRKWRGLYL